MFSTLRTRFGIPGVISVIALVFAMFGGAYAASNNSSAGKATASAKAKKGPRGPKGATGPAGPQGSAGPQGPAGPKGDTGASGTNGTNGTSATTAAYSGAECENGGVEVKSASPTTYVCNGEDGETGFTETLPSGKSEHGTWGFFRVGEAGTAYSPISFNIPLPSPVPAHYVALADEPTAECPGTSEEPAAAPGNLCIYEGTELHGIYSTALDVEAVETIAGQAGKGGAFLRFIGASANAAGPWVVTAP